MDAMKTVSIMIVGVGGQGTLLASRILGHVFQAEGYDVKVSEVHGMSQRGGSVVTYVRYGSDVASPIVDLGTADFILAFEKLEALRCLEYMKEGATLVVNTQETMPMPVITGAASYPADILDQLSKEPIQVEALDALSLALEAGSSKAVNVVLVGVLAKHLGIEKQVFLDALSETVPPKFLDMNQKAFELGYNYSIS